MSLTTAPNWNTYIDRLEEIILNSSLVMPATNGSTTQNDLVRQIIKYSFPLGEQPPDGLGPPFIFINRAPNPIVRRQKIGRDNRDAHGPERWTLEFWLVMVVQTHDPLVSQSDLYNLTEAVMTTLKKKRRLTDTSNDNPLAYHLEMFDVPYNLNVDENDLVAHNVVVRPDVLVNTR